MAESSSSKIIVPVNLGGDLAYIGWCAAEAPNQQAEAIVEVHTLEIMQGEGWAPLPLWLRNAAHPERPAWHVVSAWAPSGDAVAAGIGALHNDGAADFVSAAAVDPITEQPVETLVLVRVRCSTSASLKPWQNETDPARRAASLKFHAATRRHDRP